MTDDAAKVFMEAAGKMDDAARMGVEAADTVMEATKKVIEATERGGNGSFSIGGSHGKTSVMWHQSSTKWKTK